MLRKRQVDDPVLGRLQRRRGKWRGTMSITTEIVVPLAIPGGSREPDPAARALAVQIPDLYDGCQTDIRDALDDHRSPYTAESTSASAAVVHAAVINLDVGLTIEIGYRVSWDEDHVLGARLRDGQLLELNGSVLEP